MRFEHAWVLLFLLAPVAWAAWDWRLSTRRAGTVLKAATFAAILLALAEPRITFRQSKVATAVLVDTSASMSMEDLAAASRFATQVERARGGNWVRVIPFARNTRNTAPDEHSKKGWQLRHTASAPGHGTNIESAIRDAAASLPAGLTPRIVLVSDGNENLGSATRAIWQAQQLGIPIDTVPMAGRPKPGLSLESVALPAQVFSGERFPIEITLDAPRAVTASVEVTAEGKSLGVSSVELAGGENHLRLHGMVNSTGAVDLAGRIAAEGLGEAHFEQAIALRSPRVLLVTNDPPLSEEHLRRALEANGFLIDTANGVPEKLNSYQVVVINNWDMQAIPKARKNALEEFVKRGGGLVWIAGEHNVYVDKKGDEDALERTLPAKLAPPRTQDGTAVVLIIDKSSSMEGRKIELARAAASGVVENLRPIDSVGVLIFDNTFEWAVPLRKATDRASIKRLIAGIQPEGGTQIAPALREAYLRILPEDAVYKHIVLLTDGISEEGDSMTTAAEAKRNRVTISTVGLGLDVNRAFLTRVAAGAEGKSYFLDDPAGLEQLLLRDVREHSGMTAVEKALRPRVIQHAEILDGVDIENAPPLLGYIRFQSKPTAETILDADAKDPLLVRWQYGLGRAAVFTSDAKNRWAANWVSWPGFDRLWANTFRDLLPHAQQSEVSADFDRATGELIVDYHLSANTPEPEAPPDIYVIGPNGFRAPVKVTKVAAAHYSGRLSIGQNQGLFRVRPLEDSAAFPEVGLYRPEDEMLDYGNNEQLLRQVASATGGRFEPKPKQVFDAGGRSTSATMHLWPLFLALAILLNLAELVMRKSKGLLELFGWRPAEAR
ncbi:MAG TPA: VWA domain-containing protein [Bryobacteraceae bacterium]|nr:VWA domain-containing protein [Bryobacteraceae bacterium]